MDKKHFHSLEKIFKESPTVNLSKEDKIVIFSDIHIGNGGRNDDFLQNSDIFETILLENYLEKNYTLILNGDIEELYKFSFKNIFNRWKKIYEIFEKFKNNGKLFKIVGNHDYKIYYSRSHPVNKQLHRAIKLNYEGNLIFIFHGHQTAGWFEQYSTFISYLLKYLAVPLGMKNGTIPLDSEKKFKTEIRSYVFSKAKKIISILGHTHRPLFESLSKKDDLTIKIERLIRKYPKADNTKKRKIEKLIKKYKLELENINEKDNRFFLRSGLYDEKILVPCLFNSGSVIGKRGSTAIEIKDGKISLVYWFDVKRSQRYLDYKGVKVKQLKETDYFKATLKEQSLDYIFTRINLLA